MPSEGHDAIVNILKSQVKNSPNANGVLDVKAMRENMEQMIGAIPAPEGLHFEKLDAGGVPAEWVTSEGIDSSRVLLYLHGGAYVVGSIATHRSLIGRLVQASGVRGLIIDYRLGPEHPFPAAVEDATAAYHFLLASGIESSNIAIGGDSAGGGLAFAAMVALREAGDPMPGAAIALSPWVDLEGIGESMTTRADVDPLIDRDGLTAMAALYLNGADPRTPLASPLYADLSSLPPTLVQVGTAETLLDDSIRIAERGREAGIAIELEQFEDLVHVFQSFAPVPEALDAIEKLGEFREIRTRVQGLPITLNTGT